MEVILCSLWPPAVRDIDGAGAGHCGSLRQQHRWRGRCLEFTPSAFFESRWSVRTGRASSLGKQYKRIGLPVKRVLLLTRDQVFARRCYVPCMNIEFAMLFLLEFMYECAFLKNAILNLHLQKKMIRMDSVWLYHMSVQKSISNPVW